MPPMSPADMVSSDDVSVSAADDDAHAVLVAPVGAHFVVVCLHKNPWLLVGREDVPLDQVVGRILDVDAKTVA